MSEFMVWDDIGKEFIKDVTSFISFNSNGTINCFNGFGDTKYFKAIGLKDIDNKEIYADCSIVEILINHKSAGNRLSIGYFKFNKEYLRYEVVFIDGYMKSKTEFYHLFMSNIKIIDTIQENKLGLFKPL